MYFERLRRLAARLMSRGWPSPDAPEDPFVGVREPRRRGPGGRSAAVALMEPEPDRSIEATGRNVLAARRT